MLAADKCKWLDTEGRRIRPRRRRRRLKRHHWVQRKRGVGKSRCDCPWIIRKRHEVGNMRLASLRRIAGVRPLHQHRGPMRDTAHPHDGILVHDRRVTDGRLRTRRYAHEQSRFNMQRLTCRLGIAVRMHMRRRLWIGVTHPLQVMQAVQAEILLRVHAAVRNDTRNDVEIKAVVRKVQFEEPFGRNVHRLRLLVMRAPDRVEARSPPTAIQEGERA